MSYPLPLEQRAGAADLIIQGKVIEQSCYEDKEGNIYTLNLVDVQAYLKGNSSQTKVGVITVGGVLENRAQISYPAVQLNLSEEYVLFLEKNNFDIDNKTLRLNRPGLVQSLIYGDAQGALIYQFGKYVDIHYRTYDDETVMLDRIFRFTNNVAKTPGGEIFRPRTYIPVQEEVRTQPITNFSPATSNAGTVDPADFLNITGSGFGASSGVVLYTNADDGGATFTSSGIASDNVSWSSGAIVNKIAQKAGTGPININGSFTSGSDLTVSYSHLCLNSSFSGFGATTRQRYYLVDKNGTGGYTFQFNTPSGFATDPAAVDAFKRALTTWTCNTFVNWRIGSDTNTAFGQNSTNTVSYDNTLPAGVYARLTNRFAGSTTGGCNLANTVWWLDEMDIQIVNVPAAGFPWQFGPALPSALEFDLESTILHELGHGHGLGHVINSSDIMHFDLPNGLAIRTLNANNINAGNVKMAYSTAPLCFIPPTVTGPMIALNSGNCNLLLPLDLLYFSGKWVNDKVALEWQTAFEQNVDRFEVERSPDGIRFDHIATVAAKGNSAENVLYNCDDTRPLSGISYYRLKSYDLDGSFTYSDVISIRNEATMSAPFHISPNPAVNTIQVKVEHKGKYFLVNESGQMVKEFQLIPGNQEITTEILPSGTYYLVDPASFYQEKVILIRDF